MKMKLPATFGKIRELFDQEPDARRVRMDDRHWIEIYRKGGAYLIRDEETDRIVATCCGTTVFTATQIARDLVDRYELDKNWSRPAD